MILSFSTGGMDVLVLRRVVFSFQSADGVGGCEGYGLFLKSVMWIDVGLLANKEGPCLGPKPDNGFCQWVPRFVVLGCFGLCSWFLAMLCKWAFPS